MSARHGRFPEIELWEPGMGIYCALSSHERRKKWDCGTPVARVTLPASGSRGPRVTVYCLNHLSNLLISLRTRSRGCSLSAEAEKAAREELIVKHWGEFQELLDAHVRKSALDALEAIPSPLREALIELEERQTV